MAGQPKAAFYVVLALVVVGLVGLAIYNMDVVAPKAVQPGGPDEQIDPAELGQVAEAADADSVTTVKEYSFVPSETLPPVKCTSAYQPMQDNTVRFALNVWAGWAPIILANEGFTPGKIWNTPDGQEFKFDCWKFD